MSVNLHVFETPYDTAHAVAEIILAKAKANQKLSLPLNIAVSGGSTPKILFTILANDYAESIPWHFVRLFWVDERCVPPTNSESNFGMTYESLLKHLPIHDANIFRMQGENDPEKEAERYRKILENELPQKNDLPQFDIILLGMGDDGHTASIFPNQMELLQTSDTVSIGIHPVSEQKRITLTGKTINQATEVIFLITGKSKADVLRQIINRESTFDTFPAAFVRSNSGNADFYIDKQASSEL